MLWQLAALRDPGSDAQARYSPVCVEWGWGLSVASAPPDVSFSPSALCSPIQELMLVPLVVHEMLERP